VAELQAAAEGYTDEYYAVKIEEAQTMAVHLHHAKEQLAQFTMVMSEYEKDLKRQQKRNTLSDADRVIVVSELADIVEERTHLQAAVHETKNNYVQAKKVFAAEKKKPENGKAFGQPINAKMDEVLKKNGIDRAAMFGGTMEGNGARKLMEMWMPS
jgi:type II secretory pathway component PulF